MCRCLGAASWLYVSALPIWKRCLLGEYVSQFSTSPTSRIEPEKSNDLNGGRTRARTWGPLIKRRFVLPIFLNNVSNLDASVQTATLPLTTALTLSPPWLRHKPTYLRCPLLRASTSALRSQVFHPYHLPLQPTAPEPSPGQESP